MTSIGEIGWGSALYYHPIETTADPGGTAPADADFTTTDKKLSQIRNFTLEPQDANRVDITNFDSPNKTEETIAGLLTSGSASMELVYSPAEAVRYYTATNSLLQLTRWWQLRIPATAEASYSYLIFSGYVAGIGITDPTNDAVICQINMAVSGLPIFTAAT